MSLHNKINKISCYPKHFEPSYDEYTRPVYLNNGTQQRFAVIGGYQVSYEISHLPHGSYLECECLISTSKRVKYFTLRVKDAKV